MTHDVLEWFAREPLEDFSNMDTQREMVQRAGESGLMLVENALASGRTLTLGSGPEGD